MNRHQKIHQNNRESFSCDVCLKRFTRKDNLIHHKKTHVPAKVSSSPDVEPKTRRKNTKQRALNVFSSNLFYPSDENSFDLNALKSSIQNQVFTTLEEEIAEQGAIKWYGVVKAEFKKETVNGTIEKINAYFRSKVHTQLNNEDLITPYDEAFAKIEKSLEEFTQKGSNWILSKIHHFELNCAKYHPLRGSSYIKLPKTLEKKKAVLNIENFNDNKCLIWCLLAHKMKLDRTQNPERVSHYVEREQEIQLGNIQCPVRWQDIPTIESLNNLRINVFIYENKEICPLYISKKSDEDCINLLLIENEAGDTHYTLIRNFSRLLGNLTRHEHHSFYCYRCLHRYSSKSLLEEHTQYCVEHPIQAIKMPKIGDNILKFKNIHKQHPVPYTIYADFESLIVPVDTAIPSSKHSYNTKLAQHVPCGYAYIVIGPDGKAVKPISCYRGEDAVNHFLKEILKEKEEIKPFLIDAKPMNLSPQQKEEFKNATTCHICKKYVSPIDKRKDHCHVTGVYRGAAHNSCNLNYKMPKHVPVIFHNLKNYDAHHIMLEIGKFKEYDLSIIPNTLEKYLSFKMMKQGCPIQIVFLDSLQFLPASLEKLTKNMDKDHFKTLKSNFPDDNINLLTRKGVYPYEYITDFDKFQETSLPCQTAFYSSLTEEEISDSDYKHAQAVWNTFKIKTLGEYHDFYVKLDVLLLADIFQNFRQLCLTYYQIDPTHVYTAPGLSWEACLKMTEVELELLTDNDMLLFIERGVRGGVCQISKRFAKANNEQSEEYNPNNPKTFITYLDSNNLYGFSMSQYLPKSDFEWVDLNKEKIDETFIKTLEDTSDIGYIFEVDLIYPQELHDLHNDYPLAPERITVKEEMLSEYAKKVLGPCKFSTVPKLIPNLRNKQNYVVHYRNLKLYLKLGLKLEKIHKALKFHQAPWLKSYIDFNTDKRKQATSSFEKDFFKLLNNSIYGKTIENLRKRRKVDLCNQEIKAEKLTASPAFKNFKIFSKDLVAIERVKQTILMNRPTYVGFAILELSKVLMYEFHYEYIKKKYGNKATLLFTDTDSLTYEIETENLYKDFKENEDLFDFSEYPEGAAGYHLKSDKNKKVVGKFKDEFNGKTIHQFIGLKAKMYSVKSQEGTLNKAKGVSSTIVKKKLTHQNYYDCLFKETKSYAIQKRIGQDDHKLYTLQQNKISLSCFDDKRYLLKDGINSYAYGHYRISDGL